MFDSSPVSTPSDVNSNLTIVDEVWKVSPNFPFREAVGSLMYLMLATRPDIAFAVGIVSRYLDRPSIQHIKAVKRIFRYLKVTKDLGIIFKKTNLFSLSCYSDADYAGDPITRRSTNGYVLFLGGNPISWSSRRQQCTALSTTEAEYIAASEAVKELMWFLKFFQDLLPNTNLQPVLYIDNQGAIKLAKNPEFHARTKHIDVRVHYIREKYNEGFFEIHYAPSNEQIADVFTKPLPKDKLINFRNKLNIVEE